MGTSEIEPALQGRATPTAPADVTPTPPSPPWPSQEQRPPSIHPPQSPDPTTTTPPPPDPPVPRSAHASRAAPPPAPSPTSSHDRLPSHLLASCSRPSVTSSLSDIPHNILVSKILPLLERGHRLDLRAVCRAWRDMVHNELACQRLNLLAHSDYLRQLQHSKATMLQAYPHARDVRLWVGRRPPALLLGRNGRRAQGAGDGVFGFLSPARHPGRSCARAPASAQPAHHAAIRPQPVKHAMASIRQLMPDWGEVAVAVLNGCLPPLYADRLTRALPARPPARSPSISGPLPVIMDEEWDEELDGGYDDAGRCTGGAGRCAMPWRTHKRAQASKGAGKGSGSAAQLRPYAADDDPSLLPPLAMVLLRLGRSEALLRLSVVTPEEVGCQELRAIVTAFPNLQVLSLHGHRGAYDPLHAALPSLAPLAPPAPPAAADAPAASCTPHAGPPAQLQSLRLCSMRTSWMISTPAGGGGLGALTQLRALALHRVETDGAMLLQQLRNLTQLTSLELRNTDLHRGPYVGFTRRPADTPSWNVQHPFHHGGMPNWPATMAALAETLDCMPLLESLALDTACPLPRVPAGGHNWPYDAVDGSRVGDPEHDGPHILLRAVARRGRLRLLRLPGLTPSVPQDLRALAAGLPSLEELELRGLPPPDHPVRWGYDDAPDERSPCVAAHVAALRSRFARVRRRTCGPPPAPAPCSPDCRGLACRCVHAGRAARADGPSDGDSDGGSDSDGGDSDASLGGAGNSAQAAMARGAASARNGESEWSPGPHAPRTMQHFASLRMLVLHDTPLARLANELPLPAEVQELQLPIMHSAGDPTCALTDSDLYQLPALLEGLRRVPRVRVRLGRVAEADHALVLGLLASLPGLRSLDLVHLRHPYESREGVVWALQQAVATMPLLERLATCLLADERQPAAQRRRAVASNYTGWSYGVGAAISPNIPELHLAEQQLRQQQQQQAEEAVRLLLPDHIIRGISRMRELKELVVKVIVLQHSAQDAFAPTKKPPSPIQLLLPLLRGLTRPVKVIDCSPQVLYTLNASTSDPRVGLRRQRAQLAAMGCVATLVHDTEEWATAALDLDRGAGEQL